MNFLKSYILINHIVTRGTVLKFRLQMFVIVMLALLCVTLSSPDQLTCSQKLAVGKNIMSSPAKSDNSNPIVMSREGVPIKSGSTYNAGEKLTVGITYPSRYEFIFQTDTGIFEDGSCDSTRSRANENNVIIQMPSSGTVKIFVAYAKKYGAVSISSSITLHLNGVVNPTQSPITINQTNIITSPTLVPSTSTSSKAAASADESSDSDLRVALLCGIILGGAGIALTVHFTLKLFYSTNSLVSSFAVYCANGSYVCAVISLALVAAWATNNSSDDTKSARGFIGTPTWTSNPFAYHVVCMVGGLFFCQINALGSWTTWTSYNSKHIAKIAHVLFQTMALVFMIFSLIAINKFKKQLEVEGLVTLHSWIGVCCATCFALNYCYGCFMGLLTLYYPTSPLHTSCSLGSHHRKLGLIALLLTALAILTGISNQLGRATCAYVDEGGAESGYSSMPDSCKIANGLGISVIIASILAVFAAIHRKPSTGKVIDFNMLPDQNIESAK